MEKERLAEFADALRNKLNYFDELENVDLPTCSEWINFEFFFHNKVVFKFVLSQ